MTTTNANKTKDNVVLHDYGVVDSTPPLSKDWPDGARIMEMMEKEGADPSKHGVAQYWQASARWALLRKYGYLPDNLRDRYVENRNGTRQLCLSEDDIRTVQSTWEKLEEQSCSNNTNNDDLQEFMKTSKSCGRQLQWTAMNCAPATQFKLHAHPNLELIYCARGELHEIRMNGEPFSRDFGSEGEIQGPDLTRLNRPWNFQTLQQGEWLVNEVGSIHKSFTATNGDGCLLIVLWGGSHADVSPEQHPTRVNVQQAVDSMDDKLTTCQCQKGNKLSETFLPASEKSTNRN